MMTGFRRLSLLLCALMLCAFSAARAQNRVRYPLPTPGIPDSLGVNIHFTDPRPGEMEQLAAEGFRWIRMDFAWAGIERTKGVYDFSAYERLLAALKPHHIRAIFILDYGNDLYEKSSPRTDESRAAFGRFAAASVKHFRNQGILWEMWNEPNGGFWNPVANVQEYIALALVTGRAIREAAPEEWYIGPATSGVDFSFIEACFKAGLLQYWDAVSFHPYRNSPPESAEPDFEHVRQLIAQYGPAGKKVPILSGEWGYSELYPGLSRELQSKYIVREFLSDLRSGLIVSIWYDWHDDGPDPKEPEHHFGTVFADYRPKDTYRAAQTMARTLDGCRFNKRVDLGDPADYCLLLSHGKEVRLAVWTTASPHQVTIPASPGAFHVIDPLGAATQAQAAAGGLQFTLTTSPQYLIPSRANPLLSAAAAWRTLDAYMTLSGKAAQDGALPLVATGAWISTPSGAVTIEAETKDDPIAGSVRFTRKLGKAPVPAAEWPNLAGRSADPIRLRATLEISGLGKVSQTTQVVSRSPLRLTVLPAASDGLPVRIENPSGEAFHGQVVPSLLPTNAPQSLDIAAGEKEKLLTFPLGAGQEQGYTAQFTVDDATGRPVLATRALRFETLETFAEYEPGSQPPASDYALAPDGDPAIASKLAWSVEAPPPGVPGGYAKAVKIDYDFSAGWKFLRVIPQAAKGAPISGVPVELTMWVYGDGTGNILNIRIADATGQTFQISAGAIDWKGWKCVSFNLRESGAYWGGANDGHIHYPMHFDTLMLVDSASRLGAHGEVYMTGATLAMRTEP